MLLDDVMSRARRRPPRAAWSSCSARRRPDLITTTDSTTCRAPATPDVALVEVERGGAVRPAPPTAERRVRRRGRGRWSPALAGATRPLAPADAARAGAARAGRTVAGAAVAARGQPVPERGGTCHVRVPLGGLGAGARAARAGARRAPQRGPGGPERAAVDGAAAASAAPTSATRGSRDGGDPSRHDILCRFAGIL